MSSFREKVVGAFNLSFFFGKGIKPFEAKGEGDFKAAMRSLWITAALYPVAIVACWLHPPHGMEHLGRADLSIITTSEYVLGFFLSNAACWLFAWALKVHDRFWLFFQASNWTAIPATVISLPFLGLALMHSLDDMHMNRMLTVVAVYFAMAGSCVAYRALRINWELSVFLASFMMFCEQIIEMLMFRIYHIPIDWLG
ncbi:MAG: hypothetical protein GC185_12465 [Alphaproteobacteria bacterium]|nr:hypothetical protein [Alphaproteobacteria bacterium]